MKIKGVAFGLKEVPVRLPVSGADLVFRVRPLPYGFSDRVAQELVAPKPPARQVRNRAGEPVLMYDEKDPEYVAKLREVETLRLLVTFRYALSEDENIEWDTALDESTPLSELAKKTDQELKAVRFPLADIMAIVAAVAEASGISETMLEDAASDFSRDGTRSGNGRSSPSPKSEA